MNKYNQYIIVLSFALLLTGICSSCDKKPISECEERKNSYIGIAEANTNFKDFESSAEYSTNYKSVDSLFIWMNTYNNDCYGTTSLFFRAIPLVEKDTILLEHIAKPYLDTTPTCQYRENDFDLQLAYYWIPDSVELNNWIYITDINDSTNMIRGTFKVSLVRKNGFIDNHKDLDTLHFTNGSFEAVPAK